MTTHRSAVLDWVQGEQLLKQLHTAGVPIKTLDEITKSDEFSGLVADAINKLYNEYQYHEGAEERREVLNTPLERCHELRVRARNILNRELGILTVGGIALSTEDEIWFARGMGGRNMESVHATLAACGLTFRSEYESKFECAVRLYGGSEHIPYTLRKPH